MDVIMEFGNVWNQFIEMCHGKLLMKNKQGILSAAAADIAVQDAVSVWFDAYHPCGEWLKQVKSLNQLAADQIEQILYNIRLENPPIKKGISDIGGIAITTGTAVAGAGIAMHILNFGKLATLASAAIPAALVYSTIKTQQKQDKEAAEKEMIKDYLGQLTRVKEEIEQIIYGM